MENPSMQRVLDNEKKLSQEEHTHFKYCRYVLVYIPCIKEMYLR
jgi:hypothetical protein